MGSVYESPLPLSLYLLGAAATVVISFLLRSFAAREPETRERAVVLGPSALSSVVAVLRALGIVGFVLIFVFAVLHPDDGLSVTPLLFWVGFIVLSASLQSIIGGLWERVNPWSVIGDLIGPNRERRALPLPWWLGPLLLYAVFWFELVSGEGFDPLAIAVVVLVYTLFVVSFRNAFGGSWPVVDPLSVLFGFAGRVAPFEATDDGVEYRGWLAGLDEPDPMPVPLFASVFVLLGSTTLDNVRETAQWFDLVNSTGLHALGDRVLDSIALLLFTVPFLLPFLGAVGVAQRWWKHRESLVMDARRLAWSLIPIGVAYLLAHNMPLLISGLPQLISLLGEEFGLDLFGNYIPSPKLVWFLEIALIVGGHILGVLAAHRAAMRLAPSHGDAVKSHTVLTLLMAVFTIATLYLLSLPLVVQTRSFNT